MRLNKFNQVIKLIIALGNTGKDYVLTRHNTGFLFGDFIRTELNKKSFHFIRETNKLYDIYSANDLDFKILQPNTMMNLSGRAVKKYIQNHSSQCGISSMLLVHDDLDLKLGEYKIQYKTAPKNHNGVTSLESELNSTDFYRIRIGIDSRPIEYKIDGIDYVLGRFSQDEKTILNDVFNKIFQTELSI